MWHAWCCRWGDRNRGWRWGCLWRNIVVPFSSVVAQRRWYSTTRHRLFWSGIFRLCIIRWACAHCGYSLSRQVHRRPGRAVVSNISTCITENLLLAQPPAIDSHNSLHTFLLNLCRWPSRHYEKNSGPEPDCYRWWGVYTSPLDDHIGNNYGIKVDDLWGGLPVGEHDQEDIFR